MSAKDSKIRRQNLILIRSLFVITLFYCLRSTKLAFANGAEESFCDKRLREYEENRQDFLDQCPFRDYIHEGHSSSSCCYHIKEDLEDRVRQYRILCPSGNAISTPYEGLDYESLWFHRRSISDYVISNGAQSMKNITVCFWMKTKQTSGVGHFVSYAVPGKFTDNEFLLWDQNDVEIMVVNSGRTIGISINDGKWHSMCFTWSSQNGEYKFYQNGTLMYEGDGLASGKTIRGGGTWVIGQDQDVVGGDFNPEQALEGEITQVNIWNKLLSANEIQEFSKGCQKRLEGNVKSWSDFKLGVKGDVKIVKNPHC